MEMHDSTLTARPTSWRTVCLCALLAAAPLAFAQEADDEFDDALEPPTVPAAPAIPAEPAEPEVRRDPPPVFPEDQEFLREPPITIQPNQDGETVESVRLANGTIRYKVTPREGNAYCFIMERNDPFDPFRRGVTYRVPCDRGD